MKRSQRKWTRRELILLLDLYFDRNVRRDDPDPSVRALARALKRTPSAVALKMHNIEAVDPSITKRSVRHGSKLDSEIFTEFRNKREELRELANRLWDDYTGSISTKPPEFKNEISRIAKGDFHVDDDTAVIRIRKMQAAFRSVVLDSYGHKCCLCDIDVDALLTAGHIVPWSRDRSNRLNPRNGICLCALHDRAFDRGLITMSDDLRVILSQDLQRSDSLTVTHQLQNLAGRTLRIPTRYPPDPAFLEFHRSRIFRREHQGKTPSA